MTIQSNLAICNASAIRNVANINLEVTIHHSMQEQEPGEDDVYWTMKKYIIYAGYVFSDIVQGLCMPPTSFFASLISTQHSHHHRRHGTSYEARRRDRDAVTLHSAPEGMNWFVKTEQFCKPFPEVKVHLEAHRVWVKSLRQQSNIDNEQHIVSIVSGYRVDENDKPGGGGLMIFSAKDYKTAEEFVKNDPLIVNECVHWQLNKWIAETGDISIE